MGAKLVLKLALLMMHLPSNLKKKWEILNRSKIVILNKFKQINLNNSPCDAVSTEDKMLITKTAIHNFCKIVSHLFTFFTVLSELWNFFVIRNLHKNSRIS